MNLENVPTRVMQVWVVQMSKQPVGQHIYETVQQTIKNSPEYFHNNYCDIMRQ